MNRWTQLSWIVAFGAISSAAQVAEAAATLFGPSPYLSAADSPFGSLANNFNYLEDFEDGELNTPGASRPPLGIITSPQRTHRFGRRRQRANRRIGNLRPVAALRRQYNLVFVSI